MSDESLIVPRLLREYGDLARAALCEYLGPREPRRHLYRLVEDYPLRGGRMLRPSLLIATACAFGGTPRQALPAAVGIELLHNAFLVHDDIEDESDRRRGGPTLHAAHGVAAALNAGDALSMLGWRALRDSQQEIGTALTQRLLDEAERMARESLEGQAMDLGWRRDNTSHLGVEDYLRMVAKKTCWYTTIFPLRAGALIGSRGRFDLDRLVRFGFFLGAAFQIQDDLLNLDAYNDAYGKESCGDIYEGKRTLILLELLRRADAAERARLTAFLGGERAARDTESVRWVRELMDHYDCVAYAKKVANALAGAAAHELSVITGVVCESRDRGFLGDLPRWVLNRG